MHACFAFVGNLVSTFRTGYQCHTFTTFSSFLKIKSAATEVTAQKTQTPIVAKLTQCEMGAKAHTNKDGICIFIKFTLLVYAETGAFIRKKEKMHPISHLLS